VRRDVDGVVLGLEPALNKARDLRLVLDDQNAHSDEARTRSAIPRIAKGPSPCEVWPTFGSRSQRAWRGTVPGVPLSQTENVWDYRGRVARFHERHVRTRAPPAEGCMALGEKRVPDRRGQRYSRFNVEKICLSRPPARANAVAHSQRA